MRFKPDTESRGLENGKTVAERRETTSNVWEMAAGAAVKRTVVGAAAGRMSVGTEARSWDKEELGIEEEEGMRLSERGKTLLQRCWNVFRWRKVRADPDP